MHCQVRLLHVGCNKQSALRRTNLYDKPVSSSLLNTWVEEYMPCSRPDAWHDDKQAKLVMRKLPTMLDGDGY